MGLVDRYGTTAKDIPEIAFGGGLRIMFKCFKKAYRQENSLQDDLTVQRMTESFKYRLDEVLERYLYRSPSSFFSVLI